MSPLLHAHVQAKRYGSRTILQDLDLTVQRGELVSLVGASGCGKSTLLRLIAGLDTDYDGTVKLEGLPVRHISPHIGFIFQEARLFPWLTVAQNVAFDADERGRHHPRVQDLLEEVGLAEHANALPKQLSGGQAQRVAIARGLLRNPRLLLLDEPFSAVDAFTRMKLQDLLIRVVRHHGVTVVMVTHDLDEAVVLSDRVVVLSSSAGPVRESLAIPLQRPRRRDDDALAQARGDLLRRLHIAQAI